MPSAKAIRYDAIVIGTGQAGPPLARRLANAGMEVAIIERGRFGGTCVNTGCIPTKTLVASARAAWMARHAADYGVTLTGAVAVDMRQVKARKDAIVKNSTEGVENSLRKTERCHVYQGQAKFVAPHLVSVGESLLEAPRIFINVGGRAATPKIPGIHSAPYLTNSSMMDVDFVPPHLIVIGGSYVGLEFGQMYRRFGSEVTIVEREPRLISREDEDVSQAAREILEREGIRVCTGSECMTLERRGEQVAVRLSCEGANNYAIGSHLLLAMGRRPNTDDLGLEGAGIQTDEKGYITVDDQLRTSVDGVWALGDCNGRGAFTHTSYNDFEIVAGNLLDGDQRRVSDRITAYNIYIDPPLGRAGSTETEVRKTGRKALIGKRLMSRVSRALEKGETQGLMKILVDAESKRILGAAVFGVGGDEVIHSILDVMYANAPYTVIQRAVHIHPTVSELIPTMLGEMKPLD